MALKYKEGDKVLIKDIDWYNKNKSKSHGTVACGGKYFDYDMKEWCGKTMTILTAYQTCYTMREDGAKDLWTDEMIEGLVEEEVLLNIDDFQDDNEIIDIIDEYVHRLKDNECQINLPEGYQFKDENGNVINATKIVLEKKKKEYPKTYEECLNELDIHEVVAVCGWEKEIKALQTLLVCRDAYWKIAGEEMGLGKGLPWVPDWMCLDPIYVILYQYHAIYKAEVNGGTSCILAFPTAEMRDAFYENFKDEIEICKELL